MREWWRALPPDKRRAAIAARDPNSVREQDRIKQARRRTAGTSEQQLRIAARSEVRKAKLRGDLVPQPCDMAGADCSGTVAAHHNNYARPLEVYWLCRAHHDAMHKLRELTATAAPYPRSHPF